MLVIPLLVAAALVLLGMGVAGLLLAADGGVALPQRGERGDEQVPLDDPGPGLQPAGGSGVPHRAGRAPADEKDGMMTMGFMTPFHGLCIRSTSSCLSTNAHTDPSPIFSCHFLSHYQYCASICPLQLRIDHLLVVLQSVVGNDTCIPVGKEKNCQKNLFRLFH